MGTSPPSIINQKIRQQYVIQDGQQPYMGKIKDVKNKKFKDTGIQVDDSQDQEEQKKQQEEFEEFIAQTNQDYDNLFKEMNKLDTQLEELQKDLDKDI